MMPMMMKPVLPGRLLRKAFTYSLITTMLSMSVQSGLHAAVVGNDQLAVESELQTQRDEVRVFLDRQDVRTALLQAGVSSRDVDNRLGNLTDAQVMQIHKQIGTLPAGGDSGLGIIVTIIVIFILLDLAGVTDVFPGVGPRK